MTRINGSKGRLLYAASTVEHVENFHLDYINALRKEGYTVEVMARGKGTDFDIPFEKRLLSPKNALCIRRIKRIVKNGGYCGIILNTSLAAFLVRLALPRKNRPRVVNIVHGYLFGKRVDSFKSALLLLCERLMRKRTDAIIVMNREDFEIAQKHRLTKGKIYLTKGMGARVREVATPPEALKNRLFPEGAFLLTFVGELSKRKNQSELIDALKIIKKDIPEARLCLVGEGREKEALAERAAKSGLSDSVFLVGYRRDACDFIRAADVYVSASKTEGLPFNIVEALGAGRTVIASRIKGHEDIIEDGVDGFLYTSGSATELAERVTRVYRRGLTLDPQWIRKKYLKYEKNSVFPETYSVIKDAIKPPF